jgi:hypothetical protein
MPPQHFAMTTSELISQFRDVFRYDLDGVANETSTDAKVLSFLNEALRICGLLVPIRRHKVTMSVVENDFQIDARLRASAYDVRKVESIFVDGLKLKEMSLPQFMSHFPGFAYADSGEPGWYALEQPAVLVLDRAIDAANAVKTWTITALINPPPLSLLTPDVEPVVPADLHIHVYRLAAALSAKEYSLAPEQMQIVAMMERDARSEMDRYGSQINAPIFGDYRRDTGREYINLG